MNSSYTSLIIIFFIFSFTLSCNEQFEEVNNNDSIRDIQKNDDSISLIVQSYDTTVKYSLNDYFTNRNDLDTKVNFYFDKLDDSERIGQMIITSAGKNGKPKNIVSNLIQQKAIGGVILMGGDENSYSSMIDSFDKLSTESFSLPLLFSIDAEPGLINNRISGLKKFNPAGSIKSISENQRVAKEISDILLRIGVNQNYAPVCDLHFNKEIIGNRSYGGSTENIKNLSSQFIKYTQSQNIIATAKHFPGHGNLKGDSHHSEVKIKGDLNELEIFQYVIDQEVLSVMVGHITIANQGKYDTDGKPSSISRRIVTELLREEMNFNGLIVTDAMNMGAVMNFQTPAFLAVKAGCDLILMPTDEIKLRNSILNEIQKNEMFREQIYSSVKRIIRVKICLGLI